MDKRVNVKYEKGFLSIRINDYSYVADIRCMKTASKQQDPESLCRTLEESINEYLKVNPEANTEKGELISEYDVRKILKDITSENVRLLLSNSSKYYYIRADKDYGDTDYVMDIDDAKTILPAPEGTVYFQWDSVFFQVISFAYFSGNSVDDYFENGFLFVLPIVLVNGKHYLETDRELVGEEPNRNGVWLRNPGLYFKRIPILEAIDYYFKYKEDIDDRMTWEEFSNELIELGLKIIE